MYNAKNMKKYRVVEYEQNPMGVVLSKILPESLQPAMREGEPVYLSGGLDFKGAKAIYDMRKIQLRQFGNPERVTVEIEELF